MKITLLPSTTSGEPQLQYLTSYVVNESIVIDAGSVGFYGTPNEQAAFRHLFLSHAHIDHVASLTILLENIAAVPNAGITIHAAKAVLDTLREHIFNDSLWPNLLQPALASGLVFQLHEIEAERPVMVDNVSVLPIDVNHVVPTHGFIIEDEGTAVAISSDTAPTERFWERLRATANLQAVFLEVSFPDALAELADKSKHLTPSLFRRELEKLERNVPVFAVHLKAATREQTAEELAALGVPHLEIVTPGREYRF